MKEMDFKDISQDGFRDAIEFFADDKNEYSKEDLHSAFVVVTRLYLDELISERLLENLFVEKFGNEATNEFFEAVANSSETVRAADDATSFEKDPKYIIKSQFDLIEKLKKEF